MGLIDRYLFRQVFVATIFVTTILATLIFLTQSLRFLDLVMNAGASGLTIWIQTMLYLPGFFEIILPVGMVASVLFIYNRLTMDSELIVLRALGLSPARLAAPALGLSVILGILLFTVMGWVAPAGRAEAVQIRNTLRAQMSALIFREGIFNEAGKNVMVYIRDRDNKGNLHGLIIHDTRKDDEPPVTIIAGSGVLVTSDAGQQVLVYNGSRQQIDPKTGVLRRLDFDRYTIDLPEENRNNEERWREPVERSLPDLLSSVNDKTGETVKARRAFRVEIQKRFLIPFLVPGFALVGLSLLLIGGHDRRGQGRRIMIAVALVVLLEILFLTSYNLAKHSAVGFPLMLFTVFSPYMLSSVLFLQDKIFVIKEG